MKIKNSSHSISPDISIILTCLGMLIACPLRIFQMLRHIDPVTGFYVDNSSIVIYILYGVLALVSFFVIVLTFFSAGIPASVAPKGRRIPFAISALVFAAALFYEPLSPYIASTDNTATITQNVQTSAFLTKFHDIFAYVAGVYFIVLFVSYITGNGLHKKVKILSLAPLVWTITRVLKRITVIISIVRVSELLLELCALVFMLVFFLSFARILSDVNAKGSMWSTIACGAISTLFIFTYSMPRLMLTITGNTSSIVAGYPLNITDIACALFMIMYIITMLRSGYSVEDIEKMNNELADEKEESEKIQQAVNDLQNMAQEDLNEASVENTQEEKIEIYTGFEKEETAEKEEEEEKEEQ